VALFNIFIVAEVKERVVGDRPEFVTNSSEESESRHLSEEIPEPDPSEWKGRVQKIHDDPSEIDVGDDDEVELSEELQFLQVFVGLAID